MRQIIQLLLKTMIIIVVPCICKNLKGYYFKDNLLDMRFGPENGYLDFDTGLPIPDTVSHEALSYFYYFHLY